MSSVELAVDRSGRGKIIVDGKDLSLATKAVRVFAGVGQATVIEIDLALVDVTGTAEAEGIVYRHVGCSDCQGHKEPS